MYSIYYAYGKWFMIIMRKYAKWYHAYYEEVNRRNWPNDIHFDAKIKIGTWKYKCKLCNLHLSENQRGRHMKVCFRAYNPYISQQLRIKYTLEMFDRMMIYGMRRDGYDK